MNWCIYSRSCSFTFKNLLVGRDRINDGERVVLRAPSSWSKKVQFASASSRSWPGPDLIRLSSFRLVMAKARLCTSWVGLAQHFQARLAPAWPGSALLWLALLGCASFRPGVADAGQERPNSSSCDSKKHSPRISTGRHSFCLRLVSGLARTGSAHFASARDGQGSAWLCQSLLGFAWIGQAQPTSVRSSSAWLGLSSGSALLGFGAHVGTFCFPPGLMTFPKGW